MGIDKEKEGRIRILEVGCSNGMDALQFLTDDDKYELYGVDIVDCGITTKNFSFTKCDASELPFEDNFFDLVISIGVLEHIEPMEKLSKVAKEINRVGKKHETGIIFPIPIKSFFGSHMEKFEGFFDANVRRVCYIPPLITTTIIYKTT